MRSDCDHAEIVSIWLEEGEVDEAWQAAQSAPEAQKGRCSDDLWRKLAAQRIRRQPPALEDALGVYCRLVVRKLEQRNCYAYAEAVRLLGRVRRLLKRLGRESEFGEYLKLLRKSYGRQRHVAALLDRLEK